jgi:hypothetical protein
MPLLEVEGEVEGEDEVVPTSLVPPHPNIINKKPKLKIILNKRILNHP